MSRRIGNQWDDLIPHTCTWFYLILFSLDHSIYSFLPSFHFYPCLGSI